MGSARFETVMDFAPLEVDAVIRCEGCRYSRNLTAEQLATMFGLGTRLAEVRRRLVCSRCGHKGAKLAPIPRLEA
ncbi:MAG TPA: hypothetical protein VGR19_08935 [Allosphingosinicella sp.]|nr:hypothetical protein [Allosphingosinicella sp.]